MSGIVRKVDELGRIVIPKELRKNLNIKNSDDLEISINDNKIVLEKYYRLKSLKDLLNTYFIVLERFIKSDFIITDKENVLLTSKKLSDTIGDKLSHNYIELINLRKQNQDNNVLKVTNNLIVNNNHYFCPLIVNTDVLGSILLFSDKKTEETDTLVVEIVLFLLKEKLE